MKELAVLIKSFPLYLVQWIAGTLEAVMSDPTVTLLTTGSILLGFTVQSALWGFVVFFIVLAILRTVNSIANAIGYGLQGLGFSIKATPPRHPEIPPLQQSAVSPAQGERINIVAPVAPPASAPGSAFPGD